MFFWKKEKQEVNRAIARNSDIILDMRRNAVCMRSKIDELSKEVRSLRTSQSLKNAAFAQGMQENEKRLNDLETPKGEDKPKPDEPGLRIHAGQRWIIDPGAGIQPYEATIIADHFRSGRCFY